MATGTLMLHATSAYEAIPVPNASFAVKDKLGNILYSGLTDQNGNSATFTLDAPPKGLTQYPNPNGVKPYSVYDVVVTKPGYATINFIDVEIFPGEDAIQPIDMIPLSEGSEEEYTYVIPPPLAYLPTPPQLQEGTNLILGKNGVPLPGQTPEGTPIAARALPQVVRPEYVTVHLGTPANSSAPNTRVRFIDYIKNVTCSEIYPDWPEAAVRANIHCIVSFILNRVFTEWYPIRGYNFDITNSTTVDQYFVPGRTIYKRISDIVDGIFNVYARRYGFKNPYFTEFCNGTTATCKGLSQWGTVTLANQGLSPLQILHNYYPRDLVLDTAPSGTLTSSYPGVVLERGSTGANVRLIQNQLNRIRVNYPAIPLISNPNGTYGVDTENAVRAFQRAFYMIEDGKVGRNTWNRIAQIYSSIIKLAELNGEGIRIGLDPNPPTVVIRQGSQGPDVLHAQFILNYVAQFYSEIPAPIMDSVFRSGTTDAVLAFQRRFGLVADGIVGPSTWKRMYEVYRALEGQTPAPPVTPPVTRPPYPGYLLRIGSAGNSVRTLQSLLTNARTVYSAIPIVTVDGVFGPNTERAVRTFQLYSGLVVDGIVGAATWNALTALL